MNQTQLHRGGVVVRPAGARDRAALTSMLDELSDLTLYFRFQTAVGHPPRASVVDRLLTPTGAAWVAEHDDRLVGHAMWAWAHGTADPTAELAVVVSEPHQGNGLGLHLVRTAAADARARGATRFLLIVSAANERIIRLIRRHWPSPQVERDGAVLSFLVPAELPGSTHAQPLQPAAF